jgi:haloalkane dehalogenase
MKALRTPDDRFSDLPGFAYSPNYLEIDSADGSGDSLRLHYLDEGARDSNETLLLLHGEPSWSYLYRKMVPIFVEVGYRVVVPDLIGFGRSDKPSQRSDYTYERHVQWMTSALFGSLDLSGITLVCQDWGGLIGLRLVGENPERFKRVVVANTGMPTGEAKPTDAFLAWQNFSQEVPEMPIGGIVNMGTRSELDPSVVAAYDAPFPEERYKEGARQFPMLVPTSPDDPASDANRRAWSVLDKFDRPFLCAFSDGDPITKGGDRIFRERVPGCANQTHVTIEGGGHFLQEDCGEQFAQAVVTFVASNSVNS